MTTHKNIVNGFRKRLMRYNWAQFNRQQILELETILNMDLEDLRERRLISKDDYISLLNEVHDYSELWLDVRAQYISEQNIDTTNTYKWGTKR